MRAIWNGTVLAESDDTVVVEGDPYVPAAALRWDRLTASDRRSVCPWKGEARHWSVAGAGRDGASVAWSSPQPSPAARSIAGHVAFWRGVEVVGRRTDRDRRPGGRGQPAAGRPGAGRVAAGRPGAPPRDPPPREAEHQQHAGGEEERRARRVGPVAHDRPGTASGDGARLRAAVTTAGRGSR